MTVGVAVATNDIKTRNVFSKKQTCTSQYRSRRRSLKVTITHARTHVCACVCVSECV